MRKKISRCLCSPYSLSYIEISSVAHTVTDACACVLLRSDVRLSGVQQPQHPPPPCGRRAVPPPSHPGAHVCGTPTARILFGRRARAFSDSHCYAAMGGANGGTDCGRGCRNNDGNVRWGYYAIFVMD